jgi:integrase
MTMGRGRNRLTPMKVKAATDGTYADGGNLLLRVGNGGRSRKWILRYQLDGKVTEIGLGGADRVTLKLAREKRDQHLEVLERGFDPREEKRKQAAAQLTRKTFAEAAERLIAERREGWRAAANDGRTSSLNDWTRSLMVNCQPISKRFVEEVSIDDVEPIVRRYWDDGRLQSARRVLKRIETVFDYAKAKGWRKADNPATWAVFKHRLQAHGPTGPKGHHPALDWRDTPTFMARLRATEPSMAAMALEMMVLTACRSGEVRGMKWDEVNDGIWMIPASRMKRNREHQVPLSADAVALIKRLEPARIGKFVFPGRSNLKPIAHWAVWELVQRLTGREAGEPIAASPHGFRSSFRSWCTARHVPSEVAERCLAHERKDATQAAYDREEMLEQRRDAMERWASFLSGADTSNVVPLRRA